MKSTVVLASFALACPATPAIALAQDKSPEQTIVVAGEYQDDWNKGNRLTDDGMIELREARLELDRRNAEVAAAQNARDAAQSRAVEARTAFHDLASRASSMSDADEARSLGQDLEKYGEEWEDANDTVKSAQRDLDRALKNRRKAEKAADRAQAKIDRGKVLMAEAERLSERRRN